MWIAGPALASGYFKNEELTKESFITDPGDGRIWFKTGDIGEWHADGVLKIVGRKKSILKLSHGEVRDCASVGARGTGGGRPQAHVPPPSDTVTPLPAPRSSTCRWRRWTAFCRAQSTWRPWPLTRSRGQTLP